MYLSGSSYVVYLQGFPSENSKLFERIFYQGIKIHIAYFGLTNQNMKTAITLFSVFFYRRMRMLRVGLMNLYGICDVFI